MKSDTSTETNSSESIIRVEDLAQYGALTPAEYERSAERSDWETSSTTSSDRLRHHHSRFSESSRTSSASSVAPPSAKIPARLGRRVTFALPDIDESDDSTRANASRESQASSEYSDLSDSAVAVFRADPDRTIPNPYLDDAAAAGPPTLGDHLLAKQDDVLPLPYPPEVREQLEAMSPRERQAFYAALFADYGPAYREARDVHLRFASAIEALYARLSPRYPDRDVALFASVLKHTYYFDEDCCLMVAHIAQWVDRIT